MSRWTAALGGCNCGKLRYSVSAPPVTGYLCHCHLCQKRSGSAFSFQLVFPAGALALTQGEPLRRERAQRDGRSSASLWCPDCYSRLWVAFSGSPFVTLRAGTLDETADLAPAAQIWTSSAQAWAVKPDIPSFEEQPADFALLLDAGRNLD